MRKKLDLLFKIIIVLVSGIGLFLNFKLLTVRDSIIYFTIQSNLLCFIFYLITVILMLTKKLKKNNMYYISKGMVTMAITITFFVYWIILSSGEGMEAYIGHNLENYFVHLFTPSLIILDYIIFGEKGNLKKNYPLIWSFVLIAYIIFDIIYVMLGGTFADGVKYPYSYMNVEELGLFKVCINCMFIYVFFVGYGSIVQWLDYKLANTKI